MAWPSIVVDSWDTFAKLAAALMPSSPTTVYNFRGQADSSGNLTPTLLRLLPEQTEPQAALAVEDFARTEFASQAHLHLSTEALPNSFPEPALPEWWALMQHHGAPTRLLDWTLSPYVAAYFAVEQRLEADGAVFAAHGQVISAAFVAKYQSGGSAGVRNAQLADPAIEPLLFSWRPAKKTQRFVAQQGQFTLCTSILGQHDLLIDTTCSAAAESTPAKVFHRKIIIPAPLKPSFLAQLRTMGIAAHSLFPGIDGLGRSIAEVARLGVPPAKPAA